MTSSRRIALTLATGRFHLRPFDSSFTADGTFTNKTWNAARPPNTTQPTASDGQTVDFDDESLVTVVMTAFNSEAWIEPAIDSVLKQTYGNLQLIVVDDASTDATAELARAKASTDKRVQVVSVQRNRGTYWAKNLALTMAEGRFVTFQDSDDVSEPTLLAEQVAAFRNSPDIVAVTCNYVRVDPQGHNLLNRGQYERTAIMAPMLDKQRVVERIGYFDSVRTSGDDEYLRRLTTAFGSQAIWHVNKPLYRATSRPSSLTNTKGSEVDLEATVTLAGDQTHLTPHRQHYVQGFQEWHAKIRMGQAGPYLPFPLRWRTFAACDEMHSDPGDAGLTITASVASMPSRKQLLKRTIETILPQVDRLNVYLNGYDHVPLFLETEKIHIARSQDHGDLRDNGKFFFAADLDHGYHFTLDDDILYPNDYVAKCVIKIEQYGRLAIIGCHGVILARPLRRYMSDRDVDQFAGSLAGDRVVNLLGTATTAYHTDTIRLSIADFPSTGMADLWLAVAAKKNNVPMVSIARSEQWLEEQWQGESPTIYRAALADDRQQTEIAQQHCPWPVLPCGSLSYRDSNGVGRLEELVGVTT